MSDAPEYSPRRISVSARITLYFEIQEDRENFAEGSLKDLALMFEDDFQKILFDDLEVAGGQERLVSVKATVRDILPKD